MNLHEPPSLSNAERWRRTARTELRRARRYLLALTRDLSEEEVEWVGEGPELACVKWHVGHLALRERELLGQLVPALADCASHSHPVFGDEARAAGAADFPPWEELEDELAASRKLTEALLFTFPRRDGLEDVFLDVLNHEYGHARYVRRLRCELGRPDTPEPAGRLLELDTDASEPPRFHVPSFAARAGASAGSRRGARVVSMAGHRQERATGAMDRGHELVTQGDYRGALEAFGASHVWIPSADSLTYQGWMHSLLGDADRAEELCLQAIDVDPDFGNPYNDIGTFCLRRRDVDSAIRWFEKAKRATRYEPRHFPYINLGRLYLSLGQPERALSEFEGALEHDPGNREVELALKRIRRELGRRER